MKRSLILKLALMAIGGFATLPAAATISDAGLLNDVTEQFLTQSAKWGSTIVAYASYLFWVLALISMVWTFGTLALRKADIGDFFAEFIRFTVTTGFFWWLLANGPKMAVAVIDSLRQIGTTAGGLPSKLLTPSTPVSIGFDIVKKAFSGLSWTHPIDNLAIVLVSAAIVICMAIVAANVLIALVTAWTLTYAGVFILGFGGSRWTSDMAIGYFKAMLGIGLELLTITLLVGIATNVINGFYKQLDATSVYELLLVLCVSAVLALLIGKIPARVAALAGGGSGAGVSAGTVIGATAGAAAVAAAAAATAGAAIAAGAANFAGSGQALAAAFRSGTSGAQRELGGLMLGSAGGSSDSPPSQAMGSLSAGGIGQAAVPRSEGGISSSNSTSLSSPGNQIGQTDSTARSTGDADESAPGRSNQLPDAGTAGTSTGHASAADSSSARGSSRPSVGGIALGTMGALATGMSGIVSNKAMSAIDAAKARIGDTLGGQLAAEIRNPGAAAQARRDRNNILHAQGPARTPSRFESARQARAFLDGGSPAPMFGANTLSGTNDNAMDMAAEIAAFRDRKTS